MVLYSCEQCPFRGVSLAEAQKHVGCYAGHRYITINEVEQEGEGEDGLDRHSKAGFNLARIITERDYKLKLQCQEAAAIVSKKRKGMRKEGQTAASDVWGFLHVLIAKAPTLPDEWTTLSASVREEVWRTFNCGRKTAFSFDNAQDLKEFEESMTCFIEDYNLTGKAPKFWEKARAVPDV